MVDTYKVAVALVLHNGVTPVLATIANDILKLKVPIRTIEEAFGNWKTALKGVGLVFTASGIGLLDATAKLIEKAKDYRAELVELQRAGGNMASAVQSGQMQNHAFAIAKQVPMKVEDILKIAGGLYLPLRGDMADIQSVWAPFAKMAYVLQHQKGYHGNIGDDITAIVRAGELSGRFTDQHTGQIDMKKVNAFADFAVRVGESSHGQVSPQSLLAWAQQGGPALRGLDEQGLYNMAVNMQAMGGGRLGTAYLSLWQQMQGVMYARTARALQDLGILKPGEWHTTRGGQGVIMEDEAKHRLTGLIGSNPQNFAKTMRDAMIAHGITDPMDQMRTVVGAMNRQTTQRYLAEMIGNYLQQMAEGKLMLQGLGSEGSLKLMKSQDLETNIDTFKTAWHNLLVALSDPQTPIAISFLQSMTSVVQQMTDTFRNLSKTQQESLGKGMAAAGVGLVGAGITAVLVAAGLPGIIIGAVAGVVMLAFTSDNFSKWLHSDSISQAIAKWLHSDSISKTVVDNLKAMFDGIKSAITSFIDAIAAIYDHVKGIVGGAIKEGNKLMGQGLAPMSWHPGNAPIQAQPISLSLNVDGQTLASAMSEQLTSLFGYYGGAPAGNGSAIWSAGDHFSDDI